MAANWLKFRKCAGGRGFTIVELMIALSVLAILLLLSALTLTHIGHIYVKGNNDAEVQNTSRNIVSDLAAQLKLGGAEPVLVNSGGMAGWFCIGTTRYNYVIGKQVNPDPDSTQTKHALWRDTMKSSGSCPQLALASDQPSDSLSVAGSGRELIPGHMRLTSLRVQPTTDQAGFYNVAIGVAYGDNDLVCVRGASLDGGSDCDSQRIASNPAGHVRNLQNPTSAVGCVGDIGQQFCAASNLNVTVARRLVSE